MEIDLRYQCAGVDWKTVSETLKEVGMGYYDPFVHKKAFENSQVCVFVYVENRLIGFGRAISDYAYQAAIYDVAIMPEFQRMGIGTTVLKAIISRLPNCHFILYAFPGKENFYKKLGFRKMKTGMAMFTNVESMRERGFTE
ncbi:MAG: GNAT family N-acetyltransferase [Desulfomonilaceae bacterium]